MLAEPVFDLYRSHLGHSRKLALWLLSALVSLVPFSQKVSVKWRVSHLLGRGRKGGSEEIQRQFFAAVVKFYCAHARENGARALGPVFFGGHVQRLASK